MRSYKKNCPLEKRSLYYIFSKGIKNYVFRIVSIHIKVHSASFPWGKKMFLCMWTMQGIQISEDWHWNKHLVHKLRLHRALLNNMPFLKSEKFNSVYQSVPKQLLWFLDVYRLQHQPRNNCSNLTLCLSWEITNAITCCLYSIFRNRWDYKHCTIQLFPWCF